MREDIYHPVVTKQEDKKKDLQIATPQEYALRDSLTPTGQNFWKIIPHPRIVPNYRFINGNTYRLG